MQTISDKPIAIQIERSDVWTRAGPSGAEPEGEIAMTDTKPWNRMREIVDWKLEHEVEYTRGKIIQRARSLAEDLTRLANGLDADPEYTFNTIGVLQGNGVELDAWCTKLGYVRETLKMFRQAIEADDAQEAKE